MKHMKNPYSILFYLFNLSASFRHYRLGTFKLELKSCYTKL